MTSPLRVHYALMCLQELDRRGSDFLEVQEISRQGGIPREDCRQILNRLHDAGIIDARDGRMFALRRPLESLTALQVIQAVWTEAPKKAPAFRMLASANRGVLRKTLEAVGSTENREVLSSEGTWN